MIQIITKFIMKIQMVILWITDQLVPLMKTIPYEMINFLL
jgi:hypothetical protein